MQWIVGMALSLVCLSAVPTSAATAVAAPLRGRGLDARYAQCDWLLEGTQVTEGFGESVASAGDVNGDGYDDLIVGGNYTSEPSIGEAKLFLGSATGLSPVPARRVHDGPGAFGWSVSAAGDVNGDGYSDVIVGAPYFDDLWTDQGAAYLYLGLPSGLSTTPAWTVEGSETGALLGWSVGTAGDVNGDGFADVVVGAPGRSGVIGTASAYLGSSAGLSTTPSWTGETDDPYAGYGHSVATAGDINGDGYDDVIVGAPFYTAEHALSGRAYVYEGSASGLHVAPDWIGSSKRDQAFAYYGWSVARAGDVNADGYGDVIVGADLYDRPESNVGRGYVYLGSPSGLAQDPVWTADSDKGGAEFGYAVGTAGDVDGDGFDDVIVSAPFYGPGYNFEGKVYVFQGMARGLQRVPRIVAIHRYSAEFGFSSGTAGDVNGDGLGDVVMGAPLFGRDAQGVACAIYGEPRGLSPSVAAIPD
jgi:hypothetical protein